MPSPLDRSSRFATLLALAIANASVAAPVASGAATLRSARPAQTNDELVRFFPTAAWQDDAGRWSLPLHFEVYEAERDDPLRAALLAPLRRELELEPGTPEAERFLARASLFLVDHERRESRDVTVAGHTFRIGPTAPNGHAEAIVTLCEAEIAAALKAGEASAASRGAAGGASGAPRLLTATIGEPGAPGHATTQLLLIPPRGLSVVSDLDDTLKVSEVGSRSRVLRRTFVEPFEAVPGMAALCQRLAAAGAAFHYVSLSPWQLTGPLQEFFAEQRFPAGALELQHFRLQDGDFGDLVGDSHAKKLAVLEPLLARWPQRRFVLIGDSSQHDPEIYGELARRHPEQIAAIWIRRTPKVAGSQSAEPGSANARGEGGAGEPESSSADERAAARAAARESARYAAAFAELPPERWSLFDDPATLEVPKGW